MARRFSAGVAATVVVCSLFACSYEPGARDGDVHDNNNFRADVIECEDAIARLQKCCPDFDATPVLCNYSYDKSTGCGTTTTSSVKPALSLDESECIRETSCDQLVETKVCERAQLARAVMERTSTSSSSSSSSGSWTPPPEPTGTARTAATKGEKTNEGPVCP